MAALQVPDGVAARALEFTILTAARTGGVIGAQWDEIDLAAKTWIVPNARMKAGRERRVPLSDRALQILKSTPKEERNPFIFIGPRTGGLSKMAMATVLRRMDRSEITVHGFRSTFRDKIACTAMQAGIRIPHGREELRAVLGVLPFRLVGVEIGDGSGRKIRQERADSRGGARGWSVPPACPR
jgi:integrase